MPYVQASACVEELADSSDKLIVSGNGTGTVTSQHSTASMRTGSQRRYLLQGESQIASISRTASSEESYIPYARCSPRWTDNTGTPIHNANGCQCPNPNNIPRSPRIVGQYVAVGKHDRVGRNGMDPSLHQGWFTRGRDGQLVIYASYIPICAQQPLSLSVQRGMAG